MKKVSVFLVALSLASVAYAHEGVKNPAVKARMMAMSEIGAGMKVIGQMAQGKAAFDAAKAQAAVASIQAQSALVPTLFQANETDPKSEAAPAIWTNWGDFLNKAAAMKAAADAATANDPTALGQALRGLGGTCKACHSDYRL